MPICFSGSQRLDQSYSSYAHFHPSLGQLPGVCLNVSDFTITADSFVIIIVLRHVTPLCPFCDVPLPGTFTPGRSSSLSSGLPDSRWSSEECTILSELSTTGPSSQGCRTQAPISKTSGIRAACWTCVLKWGITNVGAMMWSCTVDVSWADIIMLLFTGAEWQNPQSVWNPCCSWPVLKTASWHKEYESGSYGQLKTPPRILKKIYP